MPLPTYNNLVTFRVDGDDVDIVLKLTSDWTMTGGLEPNVNTAEIPYSERAKLPTNLVYVSGTIWLWGSTVPGEGDPEAMLGNQWLVDCVVSQRGYEPGDTAEKVLAYTLSFADHRHGFLPPRGGRLTAGIGNPVPLGDATLANNKTLMETCLTAMGVTASVPSSVNAVAEKRQLEWLGAPAAAELGELLQYTAHVYCPQSGGGAEIWKLGNGELPAVPAERLISDITASSVSRLPRTAVFTSAPNAEARTYNQDAAAVGETQPPQWEYVVQDPANGYKWTAIASVAALGGNPTQELARGFPTAAAKDRKLLDEQLYKVIRLKGDRYNRLQCPVLRDVLYPDGTVDQPHLVATVAVQADGGGAWVNRQSRLNATAVDGATNLLSFDERLGTVTGTAAAQRDQNFTPITASTLKPTFTVEDYNTTDGKFLSVFGYTIGLGVGAISEAAAREKLKGYRPDVHVLDVPELRVVWLNDSTNNRTTLAAEALGQATALMLDLNNVRTIEVTGFFPWEIDGRVNEVRFSQAGYRTTIIVDGWACPSRGSATGGGHHGSGAGGGSADLPSDDPRRQTGRSHHAAKSRSRASHIRQGGATARQPATPATPVPPARTGFRSVIVVPTAAISGQTNRYTGTTRSGKFNTAATGSFAVGDVGDAGTANDCKIWTNGTLEIGKAYSGIAGQVDSDGKTIVFVNAGGSSLPTGVIYDTLVVVDNSGVFVAGPPRLA